MHDISLTGAQFATALDSLKLRDISGNDFCRRCNVSNGSQTYWKNFGIKGAAAVILRELLGEEEFDRIAGADNAAS